MKKVCFKCLIEKELSEFYKHKQMKDGHLNKCKECAKKDSSTKDPILWEKRKERDRNRPNKKERNIKNLERIKYIRLNDPEKYEKIKDNLKKWNKKNKHKKNAHLKVKRAIKSGKLIKPENCEICNSKENVQGHHEDYNDPLNVIWVCVKCHADIHKKKRNL